MRQWIETLLAFPGMASMGHDQRPQDANLGLGWVYYALGRALRPTTAVVIGSYRGFVPIVLARAMSDNLEGGVVHLIDPSMVDDFWTKPREAAAHFGAFGVANVVHHLATTQEFVKSSAFAALADVGLLFIDGYHTREQARFDHEAFAAKMAPEGVVMFHDSVRERPSRIYGEDRAYTHTVKSYIDQLKRHPDLQVLDLPLGDGVTIVRRQEAVPQRRVNG